MHAHKNANEPATVAETPAAVVSSVMAIVIPLQDGTCERLIDHLNLEDQQNFDLIHH
jgi:hypothetical protein